MNEIEKKIVQILFNVGLTESKDNFSEEEFKEIFNDIDSLNLMNFIVEMENEFNIEFSDEYLLPQNFTSMKSLVKYINDEKGGEMNA